MIDTEITDKPVDDTLDDEGLLSPKQAADHLGCSLRHIRRKIASGDLPIVRFGPRMIRIRPRALARYIAERPS